MQKPSPQIVAYRPELAVIRGSINLGGWLMYGEANSYPNTFKSLILNSSTAQSSLVWLNEFIAGQYEGDAFVVNRHKHTFEYVMQQAIDSLTMFNGFALHFHYDRNGDIEEITVVPFENVRRAMTEDGQPDGFIVWDNWNGQSPLNYSTNGRIGTLSNKRGAAAVYYPEFDPNNAKKDSETGQLWYYCANLANGYYPVSPVHSAISQLEYNKSMPEVYASKAENGLTQRMILWHETAQSPDTIEEVRHSINHLGGSTSAGGAVYIPGAGGLKFQAIDLNDENSAGVLYWNKMDEAIRLLIGVHPALLGVATGSTFANGSEIDIAYGMMNSKTQKRRDFVAGSFRDILAMSVYRNDTFDVTPLNPPQWQSTLQPSQTSAQ